MLLRFCKTLVTRYVPLCHHFFRIWIFHFSFWDAAIIHQQLAAMLRGQTRFAYIVKNFKCYFLLSRCFETYQGLCPRSRSVLVFILRIYPEQMSSLWNSVLSGTFRGSKFWNLWYFNIWNQYEEKNISPYFRSKYRETHIPYFYHFVLRYLYFPFVCQNIFACLKLNRPRLAIVYFKVVYAWALLYLEGITMVLRSFCFCKGIVWNLEQKSIKTVRETEFTNVSLSNCINLELFHSVFDETPDLNQCLPKNIEIFTNLHRRRKQNWKKKFNALQQFKTKALYPVLSGFCNPE